MKGMPIENNMLLSIGTCVVKIIGLLFGAKGPLEVISDVSIHYYSCSNIIIVVFDSWIGSLFKVFGISGIYCNYFP